MLPSRHRMRRSEEFSRSVRGGRRVGRSTLVVHLAIGDPAEAPRVGFVVGRAVGRAVRRNRVRRQLRHLVRERIDSLPSGALVVVRALPKAGSASYRRLASDLDSALNAVVAKR